MSDDANSYRCYACMGWRCRDEARCPWCGAEPESDLTAYEEMDNDPYIETESVFEPRDPRDE